MSCLFTDKYVILLANFVEMWQKHENPDFGCELHFILQILPVLAIYFYGTWPTGKCTGKLTHRCVIIRMVLTHTSFCVLKFMSPACRPYFADDARLVYMHHPKLKSKHIHSCLGKLCLLTYLLTSMQQSPSCESNRFSVGQEFSRLLWNPKFRHRHMSLSWARPIQSMSPHPTS